MKMERVKDKVMPEYEQAWEDTKVFIDQLEKTLTMLRDRIELLVKRRRETAAAMEAYSKRFAAVGQIESSSEESSLAIALGDVSSHADQMSGVYLEQADNENIQVIETIGYYVGMCNAVRECLKTLMRMCATRDTLGRSVQELSDKKASGAGVDAELEKMTAKRDAASKLVDDTEKTLKESLVRFNKEKQYDIKQMLRSFVDLQMQYTGKVRECWAAMPASVEAIRVE